MKLKNVVIASILSEQAGQRKFAGLFSYLGAVHQWNMRILRAQDEIKAFFGKKNALNEIDGVIYSGWYDTDIFKILAAAKCPVVIMENESPELDSRKSNLVVIRNDADEIARCAVKTFTETGRYKTFAYVHDRHEREWSNRREAAFRKALKAKDSGNPKVYGPSGLDEREDSAPMIRFLESIEYPAAILAVNDMRAAEVIAAAKEAGISVPGKVSVLGIDNDPYMCESVTPGISSIEPDFHAEGKAAAEHLDRMMKSRQPSGLRHLFFGVSRVVARKSTKHLPPAKLLVERACNYIKDHATEGITPNDVAVHLGISRPLLDLRFRETQKTSVGKLITESKLSEVARLLRETSLPLTLIQEQCGFKNANALKNIFKNRYGTTMREWRKGT